MGHLGPVPPENRWSWHVSSPVTLRVRLSDMQEGDLTDLVWRLRVRGGSTVAEVAMTAAQDDADALVTGELEAADTAGLAQGRYPWQVHGSVGGTGPEVLAEGTLDLWPLYAPLPAPP